MSMHMEILLLLSLFTTCALAVAISESLDHSVFPNNFLFGIGSSAYQYEGAYLADGKGLNIWDVYTRRPDSMYNGSNGDVAVDQYHRYQEDINLLEAMNVNSYRFSISWARILPKGRFGEVNLAGINYYNRLIDALLLKGIQPFVTIYHLDYPQELEDRYKSWLSPESMTDFAYYADLCFKSFGDRVKYWITINQPCQIAVYGYRRGMAPITRCSPPFGHCKEGDSEKEPFVVVHNLILAHAAAVDIYRTKYQTEQGGRIGLSFMADWYEPFSNSTEDKLAVERALSFNIKWILDPIIFGEYPKDMQNILGDILPKFSDNDKERLKRGLDFVGINHYQNYYVQDCLFSKCDPGHGVTRTEGSYLEKDKRDGVPIMQPGMEKLVTYIKDTYGNTPMFITENGIGNPSSTDEQYLNDFSRINYMARNIDSLMEAIRKGADVRGYFVWTLLDDFEFLGGYSKRFGLHHVDRATLMRTPRSSASWYKEFITKHKTETLCQK